MSDDFKQRPRVRLGGGWRNQTKAGEVISIPLNGGSKIEVWPNKFKKGDKDPDVTCWVVGPAPQGGGESKAPPSGAPQGGDDDIPF